jgi:uncharacterized protein (TIGR03083 family)
MIHAERAALAADLALLDEAQWQYPSLCGQWSVREVVAHLTAAATTGRVRWVTSLLGARFDPAVHNQRRLAEHLGSTPAETLERFREVVTSRTAASGHTPAWLGEVVVHGQDIRRPLGLETEPSVDAATEVARFFVSRDFAVNSRSAARGLRLEATDGPFSSGAGPLAQGTTLALTMAMAGRPTYCADLTGPGVDVLQQRSSAV